MIRAAAAALAVLCSPLAAQDLVIATGGHYPPYIYDPETPDARGFDKDLVDLLCDRGGYTCTWVDLPMNDIFQALARGDVDVVAGGFGYSQDRDAIVDFTCPYSVSDENTGDFIATSTDVDLITARIGVLDQSLYQSAMNTTGRTTIAYATEQAALDALRAGDVDAVFGSHNATTLAQQQGGFELVGQFPTFSGGTVLGVAETAPQLRAHLDDLLAEISADGTLAGLQMRWLGENQGDVIARCLDPTALT